MHAAPGMARCDRFVHGYLVARGRVLGVDWKERHRAALRHQRAVVLGREPHWRHKYEAENEVCECLTEERSAQPHAQ